MKLLLTAAFLSFCLFEHCIFLQTRDQVFSITAGTLQDVAIIKNVSSLPKTVLWQPASPEYIGVGAEVHLYISGSTVETIKQQLKQHGITYKVLLEDAQQLMEKQTRNDSGDPRSSNNFLERYHPLEEIYNWILKTTQDNPNMVKTILIGSSFEKEPLYVLKLSVGESSSKKAMWIDCGIHAREWISPAFCMWFVQHAIDNYKLNPEIAELLNNMEIYVLPVMNPDGYKYTWTTNRMWRKNRALYTHSDCVGADLNRNFDANWCTEGSSQLPCDQTYCGLFPESELEARAVAGFLRHKRDIMKLYISIHSYSQMLLFPYSYTYREADNHNELYELVRDAAAKIKRHYRTIYKYGSGSHTIYLAPGGSDDWAYDLGIKYSFTFELQDRGQYGFLLPPDRIKTACNEALTAVKSVATEVMKKTH